MRKVARCRFLGTPQTYDYAVPRRLEGRVEEGTVAVVDTPQKGYAVVSVVEVVEAIDSEYDRAEHKPLVDVVDDQGYQGDLERKRRRAALQRELDRLVQEQDRILDYERMAASDPRIAELLDRLKETREES